MSKTISVVIPAYNNADLLMCALKSVLMQEGVKTEIIVSDDSLNDEIENTCRNYPVRYFCNRPSLGAVRNWNYAISQATGDYIILLHHDESFKSSKHLSHIMSEFNKDVDVVISNIEVHTQERKRRGLCPGYIKRFILKRPSMLLIRNVIGPCACVAFKKEKLVRFDDHMKWLVDMEWYYRILNGCHVSYLEDNWVISQHGHAGQITVNLNIDKQASSDYNYLQGKYKKELNIRFCLQVGRIIGFIKRYLSH